MARCGVRAGDVVERLYREIRALRIYEGATEVQQLIIGRDLLKRPERREAAMTKSECRLRARRHVRARQPAAARRSGRSLLFDAARAAVSGAAELRDRAARPTRSRAAGASRTAIVAPGGVRWTYAELSERANRIARVLVDDLGVVPGNRVLLRGPNSPMMAACWFAVIKAGGIAVGDDAAAARARS